MDAEYMTFAKAAMRVGLCRMKAHRLVKAGVITPVDIGGVKFWEVAKLPELQAIAETDFRKARSK